MKSKIPEIKKALETITFIEDKQGKGINLFGVIFGNRLRECS